MSCIYVYLISMQCTYSIYHVLFCLYIMLAPSTAVAMFCCHVGLPKGIVAEVERLNIQQ